MITSKKEIRRQVLNQKKSFTNDELNAMSNDVWLKVEALTCFEKADVVMLYWSIQGEVNSHKFIEKWHGIKKIVLPVIHKESLLVKEYTGKDDLMQNAMLNVPEPVNNPEFPMKKIDLIIVPGIAFTMQGERLGRGGGYYDRFLKKSGAYKLGVCFPFQRFDYLTVEEHDVKMDHVIY